VDPDLVLLERWRGGDRRAGEDLFARHFADIYRFLEHKAGGEADELAQRTFLACVAARDQFRGRSSFRTYVFAIARNELYTFLRRQSRTEAVDFSCTSLADIVTTPGSRLDRAQRVEQLRAALGQLPVEQQLLLELHYWHDLDAAALGEVFGASGATVRVRLLRARQALRDRLSALALEVVAAAETDRLAAALADDEDGA
jgi:RNA polymerase sigma-70 factor (ECF subfamily)